MRWIVTCLILGWSLPAAALDLALYGELLERHTRAVEDTAGTRVDYAALRGSADWERLVASLDAADPDALPDRAHRLAFWINVYNVLAIDVVVKGGPVDSIRDLGSWWRPVWKRPAGRVGGREVTLDEVEHAILRPMGEPRIHVAIVCASTSCPSLLRVPYRPETLEEQLARQSRAFVADPRKGLAVDREARQVRVSKIFSWFEEDFAGGGGVLAFVVQHAPEAVRPWLEAHEDELRLNSLDYDWTLNALDDTRR